MEGSRTARDGRPDKPERNREPMTKKYKKLTSGALAAALALASIGMQSRPARAEELEEKQYVIVAETDAAYERAVEAALEGAEPQDEGLSDHNVAVEGRENPLEEGAPRAGPESAGRGGGESGAGMV